MPPHEHNPFNLLPEPGVEDDEYGAFLLHSRPMCSRQLRNLHLQGQIVHPSMLPAFRG